MSAELGPTGTSNPRLIIEGCYLRFNPDDVASMEYLTDVDPDEVVLGGVVHLRGFTPDTGKILYCSFVADPDIKPGTVLIERMPPMPALDPSRPPPPSRERSEVPEWKVQAIRSLIVAAILITLAIVLVSWVIICVHL